MGGLQALAFCPAEGAAVSDRIAAERGCLEHLLALLKTGPLALRSLAAGALCNLTLGNPAVAVRLRTIWTQWMRNQLCACFDKGNA